MSESTALYWFRRDLRLADNPALNFVLKNHDNIIPVYIHAPNEEAPWQPGGASRWWLHHSLRGLASSLEKLGAELLLEEGSSLEILLTIAKKFKVNTVCWNRLYDPKLVVRDKKIKSALKNAGLETRSFAGSLLCEPWEVRTGTGGPYKVYTPFSKAVVKKYSCPAKLSLPRKINLPVGFKSKNNFTKKLLALQLLPKIPWDAEFKECWVPGEHGANSLLRQFTRDSERNYTEKRDIPSVSGTSKLAPYLHFGEISAQQVWRSVVDSSLAESEKHSYLRQIIWRDFAHSLIFNFPDSSSKPLRAEYASFPWRRNKRLLVAWQKGQTGFPIVDAGMRQLWQTGWMHNRVRMVAASLLVKHLLQPWQEGAKWFWDTLLDADLANNTMGWQWVAGCGADAAPYFRVFNPVRQGERFDKQGDYVKKWLPELSALPSKWIHCPWEAPAPVLLDAGVKLGIDYPKPLILPAEGRSRALEAYDDFKLALE